MALFEVVQAASKTMEEDVCVRAFLCQKTYADPGVFECICGSDSLGWINGQHLVDQVFGLWSHRVPLWGWELLEERRHKIFFYSVPPTLRS